MVTSTTVLVAGGTGGLGRAVTLAFLQQGAKVVVTYRKSEEFNELRDHAGVQGFPVDVTDETAVFRLVDGISNEYGRLDAMVNCVGGYVGGVKLWDTDVNVLDRMLTQNVRSGYVLSRAVAPVMIKQAAGSIVNVAAKAAIDPPSGAAAYAASKAAAIAMMNSLAADLRGTGVRVNSVLPSLFDTEANRRAMPTADFAKWPKPADIARVIVFLCSDDAKLIHGASIPV